MMTLLPMVRDFYSALLTPLRREKGQSMVELAIILPFAMFLIIGVFEVGWALRGYFVVVNANREATRFAVRTGYLDFSERDVNAVGYGDVLQHAVSSLPQDTSMDFQTNSALVITHMVIDTGYPCDPNNDVTACNCEAFTDPAQNYNVAQDFTLDNLVLHPGVTGFDYYVQGFPTTAISDTRFNYQTFADERARENNKFVCELLKKGGVPSANNYITTEMFYDQPQLFGFPLISNPFTDPVPMYSSTTMRLAAGSRLDAGADTVGPICDAYPFAVHQNTVNGQEGYKVNIFNGMGGSDLGWLAWNPDHAVGSQSEPYLANSLRTSRLPINDFTNARDGSDHTLSVGDYVASLPGDKVEVEANDNLLSALVGRTIRVPVWDTFNQGAPDAYHIAGFAWVRIEAASDINLPSHTVLATYLGDATSACLP